MTRWTRAHLDTNCGRCGAPIPIGVPMLCLKTAGMRRELQRCEGCAGEPVDVEQIEAEDVRRDCETRERRPPTMLPPPRPRPEPRPRQAALAWRGVATIARDFKRAQGGDE